jgi:hypothetical protein
MSCLPLKLAWNLNSPLIFFFLKRKQSSMMLRAIPAEALASMADSGHDEMRVRFDNTSDPDSTTITVEVGSVISVFFHLLLGPTKTWAILFRSRRLDCPAPLEPSASDRAIFSSLSRVPLTLLALRSSRQPLAVRMARCSMSSRSKAGGSSVRMNKGFELRVSVSGV